MRYRHLWEKAKRVLAMTMALALFANCWLGTDLQTMAAGDYTVELSDDTAEYTGENQLPQVIVQDTEENEVSEENYNVIWTFNETEVTEAVQAGTYFCEVTGNAGTELDGWSDSDSSFVITVKALTEDMLTLNPSSVIYKDADYTVAVEVKEGDVILEEGQDYELTSGLVFKETGNHTVSVAGKGNYTGTISKEFVVCYDPDITEEQVEVSGAVWQSNTWYFQNEVVIEAIDGYEIVDGDTSITESKNDVTLLVKDTSTDTIGEVDLGNFVKDNVVPENVSLNITYVYPYDAVDGTEWAQAIESAKFQAEDLGAGLEGIYYTTEISVTDPNFMTRCETGESVSLESDTVYYFCAKDHMGNVTAIQSMKTRKLDQTAPSIVVKDGEVEISPNASVYWNQDDLTEGKKSLTVEVQDNVDGTGYDPTQTLVSEYVPAEVNTSETKTITNSVRDYVGNEASHNFSVVYDVEVPVISSLAIDGIDEKEILTSENVTVYANVTDANLREVTLVNTQDVTDAYVMTETTEDGYTHMCVISTDTYKKAEYQAMSVDQAGNMTTGSDTLNIEIDKIAPELLAHDIVIDQTVVNGWVKADTTFTVTVDNHDNSSADLYLEYKKDHETEWIKLTVPDQVDGDTWEFSFTEIDETYKGDYLFRVGDTVGNISSEVAYGIQKDKKMPETSSIQAEYKAYEGETETNSKSQGLFAEARAILDRIFAKTEIEIVLYIKDEISGVTSIDYLYDGQAGTAYADMNATAVIEGELYSIIPVTVTGEHADVLTITGIEDQAGNFLQSHVTPSVVAQGTTILVVDSVAPTLQAKYPECTNEETGVKYYRSTSGEAEEVVTLTFTEAYYDKQVDAVGEPVKPALHIFKDQIELSDISSYVSWGDFSENKIKAVITLPYETTPGETEYQIKAEYQDGSGNVLVWAGTGDSFGSISGNAGYASGIFVLDNKNPELTMYKMTGDTDKTVDQIPVYYNKTDAEDVTITFTVDEKKAYWNPQRLHLTILDTEDNNREVVHISGDDSSIDWTQSSGSRQTGVYAFDGEADKASAYEVQVTYTDKAGNVLTLNAENPVTSGALDQGIYTSESFILDHVLPILTVTYAEPVQIVDEISYYADTIEVQFQIQEDYVVFANGSDVNDGLEDCVLELYKDGSLISMPEVAWTKSDDIYTGIFRIQKDTESHLTDGVYQFRMAYQDAANNAAVHSSATFVLDTVAPEIQVSYAALQGDLVVKNSSAGRDYYDQAVKMILKVTEANGRYEELQDILKTADVVDIEGNTITGSFQTSVDGIDKDTRTSTAGTVWEFDLSTEANYTIPLEYKDLAGNLVQYAEEQITVDTTEPAFTLSYEVEPAGFLDAVNYKDFGFLFADRKLTVRTTAQDTVAGVHRISYTITDENSNVTEFVKEFDPAKSQEYTTAIPLTANDFKGSILVNVTDWSENQSEQTRGHIVESTEKHTESGSAVITTQTRPSRTVNGEDYYNKDVKFNLTFKDDYSGLRKWSYKGGNTLSDSKDYGNTAGTDLSEAASEEITYTYSKDLVLSASSNNENDVKVTGEYTDNAGHKGKVEKSYNIDITKPAISVEYDLKEPKNLRFFNQPRTAKVTIRERNFDEDDVDFIITNTDGKMPSISSWESSGSGDDTKHVCHVTFYADGDYTFTVEFQDMAGNKAEYERVDDFTIDQTKPAVTVTYDHNQSMNELYYAQTRTATIDILEHNFDPAFIDVQMTAEGAEIPAVSGWSRNGDHNIATVTFRADGDYTFDISGKDQAENLLDDYAADHFIIDQTAPELEIFGIDHMSANNGEVRPGIRYSDTNYDPEGTFIQLNGYKNGEVTLDGTSRRVANGLVYTLDDFAHIPEMDDMYMMEAVVQDLAGNQSDAIISFSVNRFGSVYTFDEKTEVLLDAYYTSQERKLVITETNVDTLKFMEITCNLNGNLRTLEEGKDYTLGVSGDDASWKQYTYEIAKDNFAEEGTYILTIYSEDRASNASDNGTKGKKIEFVVDKTSPSVLISGVEQNGQYRENSREITLDVQDNIRLAEVEVQLDGETFIYSASEVMEQDGKITITAESANHWQSLNVIAYDAAGNEQIAETIEFLVTSNVLVQFFMNKVLFYSTIAGMAAAGAGIWGLLLRSRKRK